MLVKKSLQYSWYGFLFGFLGGYLTWHNKIDSLGKILLFSLVSAVSAGIIFFVVVFIFELIKSKFN